MKYVFPKFTKIAIAVKEQGISRIKLIRVLCEIKMRVFLQTLRRRYQEAEVLWYKTPVTR